MESVPSQHVETRIKPAFNFVNEGNKTPNLQKAVLNQPVKEVVEIIEHDNHKQPINYFMSKPLLDKNLELKKTIQDGIKAAEQLEETIKFGENTGPVLFGAPAPTSTKTEPIIEIHGADLNTGLNTFQKQNSQQNIFVRHPPNKLNHSQKYSLPQRRPTNHHIPRRPVTYTQVVSKRPQTRPQFIMGQHSLIHNQYKKPGYKHPYRQSMKPYYAPNFNQYRNIFPPVNIRPLKTSIYPEIIEAPGMHDILPGKTNQIILGKPAQIPTQPINNDQKILHSYPTMIYPAIVPRPQIVLDNTKINQRLDSKSFDKQSTLNGHILLNKPIITSPKPVYHHTQHMIDFEDTSPKIVLPTVRPAINTGFKPDSVIIEGGFKPIVREQDLVQSTEGISSLTVNRRSDTVNEKDDIVAEEDNIGEIFVGKRTEPFEPMFIPSPPDRQSKNKNKSKIKINVRPDAIILGDKAIEMGDDKIAMAAEHIESYYLPPVQYNHAKLVGIQGDIELPVGTVITYDGKAVSDSALSSSIQVNMSKKPDNKYIPPGISKTEQLIRGTPQFAPFKGDIPPPIPENLNPEEFSQLSSKGSVTKLPPLSDDNTGKPSQISTHLKLVRQYEETDETSIPDHVAEASRKEEVNEATVENDNKRSKREAHHTPEHTEQQQKQGLLNGTSVHDHSDHDHDHDHDHHGHHHHKSSTCTLIPTLSIITLLTAISRLL